MYASRSQMFYLIHAIIFVSFFPFARQFVLKFFAVQDQYSCADRFYQNNHAFLWKFSVANNYNKVYISSSRNIPVMKDV